ncbi:MAG: 3-methyl-2-oxobutanoate hydroxymethyltransferase [Elusimicrobia bacterium]|nr:3-methyl-2-oxobutanoate hydroxymethyltransferase [Elusimicrobiota bacterium]
MVEEILGKKHRGEKIVMLTAYDHPTARIVDEAGIDLLLVGDSLGNVVYGLERTTQVSKEMMLRHVQAVCRAAKKTPVIADMPFDTYQVDRPNAVFHARDFMYAGCAGVKIEWFKQCLTVVDDLRAASIPVMGHIGLTPQTAEAMKVKGRGEEEAKAILSQARALEAAGCFAVVLECVPDGLAAEITQSLNIPTIGIGAGPHCDGQVLVVSDMLGLNDRAPRFVRRYADLGAQTLAAIKNYKADVESGVFPGPEQTFR